MNEFWRIILEVAKKSISFVDDKKKKRDEEDPASYHTYEDTPDNLCSLALRVASKSALQTSIVNFFILCYSAILCWANSTPKIGSAEFTVLPTNEKNRSLRRLTGHKYLRNKLSHRDVSSCRFFL